MSNKNILKSSNLLVIEPMGASGELLLQAVKKQGFRSIVATTPEVYETSLADFHGLIDETIYVDFSDMSKSVQKLVAANDLYSFCGVVVAWEFLTEVAARVADQLGLRGPDASLARARRNKHEMGQIWLANNCATPALLAAVDPDHSQLRGIENLSYPVVVKPAENSASFGVSVIEEASQIETAVKEASFWTHEFPHNIPFDRTVLVQEYLPGQEFSVEAVSDRGRYFTWGVTMKFTTQGKARAETGHIFPAPIPSELSESILELARRGTEAIGISNGISHTEIKLSESGIPYLIESGPRPAGDFIPRLVEVATGENPLEIYVEQAISGLPTDFRPRKACKAAAISFLPTPTSGTLRSIDFPKELQNATIIDTRITSDIGAAVTPGSTNIDRLGWVMIEAATPDDAHVALLECETETRIVVS